jgi:hypothetical protein
MDRRRKVELFEQIRREYRVGIGTVRGVAKQFGGHRRMVRQALASVIPPRAQGGARAQRLLIATQIGRTLHICKLVVPTPLLDYRSVHAISVRYFFSPVLLSSQELVRRLPSM